MKGAGGLVYGQACRWDAAGFIAPFSQRISKTHFHPPPLDSPFVCVRFPLKTLVFDSFKHTETYDGAHLHSHMLDSARRMCSKQPLHVNSACCRLENIHVYWFLASPEFCSPSPTPPVLVEKAMGGVRVNIDAHSVPSQPQSIWNNSSLWRTNNLEETLIITHPFTLQNLLEASLSPLSSSSYTSPSLHLVNFFFFTIRSLVISSLYAL